MQIISNNGGNVRKYGIVKNVTIKTTRNSYFAHSWNQGYMGSMQNIETTHLSPTNIFLNKKAYYGK